ncbi:MAG: WYL domain-containing protein [Polyangiaceae bacterium]|nr:WYL domain-containing protein [Polyangiaceae bacterium]
MAKLGRPTGRFTQHRRLEVLRDILTRNPKGVSIYELADVLHVAPRSVRRYLIEVRRQLDLEAVPTRGGGRLLWRIPARDLPRKVELRRTQVYALLAARRLFDSLRGSALHEEISAAVDRLLPLAQRTGRGPNAGVDTRLEERFLYLPYAPKDYADKRDELDDLFQAVSDLRPLVLKYRAVGRPDEERIVIHPYALVWHRDSLYCVGHHTGRGEVRTFAVDRMRDTQLAVTERFELPAAFKVDQYFHGELGVWRAEKKQKVVIDFDAQGAEYVRHRRAHSSQKLAPLAGGGVRLTMTVGSLTPVVSWVLEWGARARVVEPPELVERVTQELEGALAKYARRRG